MNEKDKRTKQLSKEEEQKLEQQNSRLVTDFQANKYERECRKNWDLFYKRNETNFFKDRNWTTREFQELIKSDTPDRRLMLEVGCGVGNLIFPLLDNPDINLYIYGCDFSHRACEFVKNNPLYDEARTKVFQCDITDPQQFNSNIKLGSLDLITMIFVLSAIHPEKFSSVIKNLKDLLKPGGMILFRDYGRYDMAMIRFKPGTKITDNFYVRQDGTRSYFFTIEEVDCLLTENGFTVQSNEYVHRRTINPKMNVDVPRIFVQGKFIKQ